MNQKLQRRTRSWVPLAVATGVLLYLALFGPACWLVARSPRAERAVEIVYAPVLFTWENSPIWIRDIVYWYAQLGAATREESLAIHAVFLRTQHP